MIHTHTQNFIHQQMHTNYQLNYIPTLIHLLTLKTKKNVKEKALLGKNKSQFMDLFNHYYFYRHFFGL